LALIKLDLFKFLLENNKMLQITEKSEKCLFIFHKSNVSVPTTNGHAKSFAMFAFDIYSIYVSPSNNNKMK